MPAGHSYSYFTRAKHFRLAEKSGRSNVIHGVLTEDTTNGRSLSIFNLDLSFTRTNGRSFVASTKTEFNLVDSVGSSQNGNLDFSFGVLEYQAGPTHFASGDYSQIFLINKFGFRNEAGYLRGFNVAQTQPQPTG